MNNQEVKSPKKMTIMIRGHQATLYFAEHPDPKVAERVKQALLNSLCATTADYKRK